MRAAGSPAHSSTSRTTGRSRTAPRPHRRSCRHRHQPPHGGGPRPGQAALAPAAAVGGTRARSAQSLRHSPELAIGGMAAWCASNPCLYTHLVLVLTLSCARCEA